MSRRQGLAGVPRSRDGAMPVFFFVDRRESTTAAESRPPTVERSVSQSTDESRPPRVDQSVHSAEIGVMTKALTSCTRFMNWWRRVRGDENSVRVSVSVSVSVCDVCV